MDLGIRGKTAVVCGAGKGIGRAAALALAQEGARLTICSRDAARLEATAADLRAQTGAEVLAVPTNLSDDAEIDRLVERTLAQYGGLDILINNTGGPPAGKFEQHTDAAWQAAFESLLLSVVRLTRLAIPHMRDKGSDRYRNLDLGQATDCRSGTLQLPARRRDRTEQDPGYRVGGGWDHREYGGARAHPNRPADQLVRRGRSGY
jgi:3-oxoacyl-[acyl-carrier protein] reductase